MRNLTFSLVVALVVFGCGTQYLSAGVSPGDVAVIGLQADPSDQFAWVTLVDLPAGEVLSFSDVGLFGGSFGGGKTVSDGGLTFTVPAGGLPAGTVQLVDLESGPLPGGYSRLPSTSQLGPRMMLGTFGDQLVIFSGTELTPNYLFAVTTNASQWGTNVPNPNFPAESELYPGLVEDSTALALGAGPLPGDEADNVRYEGISRGTREELFAALGDVTNWVSTNDPIADITNGTLVPGFEIIEPSPFIRADANADGNVDLSDAIRILLYLFGNRPELPCLDAGDANDDGTIDISDSIALLDYLFGGGAAPLPPYPVCGHDPTGDPLSCYVFVPCP